MMAVHLRKGHALSTYAAVLLQTRASTRTALLFSCTACLRIAAV